MKKILTLFCLLISLSLYSCNIETNTSYEITSDIYGPETTQTVLTQATSTFSEYENKSADNVYIQPDKYDIDVDYIYQNPELPTGCEVTSLTMLLNYLGFDVSKTELVDNFLTMDYQGTKTFDQAFIGSPYTDAGYGCFAPVIVSTAQDYLDSVGSTYEPLNITGTEFDLLYDYISNDNPVVVWTSMYLMETYEDFCYTAADGTDVYWYVNEHCMLLTGYDKENNTITAADPLCGLMLYNADAFKEKYDTLGKQAVVILTNHESDNNNEYLKAVMTD
ncbi:MAG: C39 family peptidase [Oscillospiraceae bacterium]|nr:C39 family peptidase [Oscillospiraceae bacterium]